MLGFDGAFLGRIDQQDKDTRAAEKTMEMVWEGSDSLGQAADLFTGILPNVYWPPATFCFDLLCGEQPIMDDPRLSDYNVDERVDTFIQVVQNQTKMYATNNLVITMGNDFNYQQANVWFKNMDKLFKYVNARQANGSNINLFYSTPSCYLKALNQANVSWPVKNDDFLPYASGAHTYWTGFFSSRPAFKRMEREASSFLAQCKQIDALAGLGPQDQHEVAQLREAVGVAQHHDAITGTERQHVADDYARQLAEGIGECQDVVADGINKLSKVSSPIQYQFCDLLNISQCHVTENLGQTTIVLWNSLSRTVNHYVRLPVKDGDYSVTGAGNSDVPVQITPLPKELLTIPGRISAATHELTFRAKLPPVGFATYLIKKVSKSRPKKYNRGRVLQRTARSDYLQNEDVVVQNEFLSLAFDQATGALKSLTNLESKDSIAISQSFGYYIGSVGDNSKEELRAAGAYISRPNCSDGCWKELKSNGSYEVVKGALGQEVRQYINPWISQVIRLHTTSKHVNFEWQVGPIPIGDDVGKEIISRFSTSMKTGEEFWTDSNGRQNIRRVRNFRSTFKINITEPVASNYYPVVDRLFVRDNGQKTQLTILTDRAQGGASLNEGQVELMVHRRLLVDDWLGVSEPLNEVGLGQGLVIRGTHRLILAKIDKSAARYRALSQASYWHPTILFTAVTTQESRLEALKQSSYTGIADALPDNVNLLSIEQWKGSSLLVRLEHMFDINEDPLLSQPITVDLQHVFHDFDILAIREMTLDGNIALTDVNKLTWQKRASNAPRRKVFVSVANTTVTLSPMEIRTFQIEIKQ
ncbi:hypothetical protein RvY_13849-2 [Ramazzottius varieornatus]|uniref:Alpha-mannosidase n=1 Tax=Ramazzottius varieornatus TaxID=947166 RepID=A0A1D1VWQ4_RAMVA|nr:hypothetical protein RvY_13849-2 [Ramazzottius varieornatus]